MKKINIYLNKEERKKCEDLKYKYKLSLTTICDILGEITVFFVDCKRIQEKYLYANEKGTKTSIQCPKEKAWRKNVIEDKNKSKFYTNCIKIYIKHDIKKFIKDPNCNIDKYYSKINQKLTTTTDEFYDYNKFLRYQRRNLRENKDYYKNEIDKMENR